MPQDEIISAYLDGELGAAERAEVERWLAADPAARKLLDGLRIVGDRLRQLPRQRLAEDLSGMVVREAQRRMLMETAASQLRPAPSRRKVVGRRTLAWLAGAAAVVAAIVVYNWRPPAAGPRQGQIAAEGAKAGQVPNRQGNPAPRPLSIKPRPLSTKPRPPVAPETAPSPDAREKTPAGGPADRPFVAQAAEAQRPGDGVLVVHFDVAGDVVRAKAFDKLLDGNGLRWRRQHDQTRSPGELEIISIYAEAAPDEVAAALAALSAEPRVFRSVAVAPLVGQSAQDIVREYGRRADSPPTAPAGAMTSPSGPERAAASRQRVLFVLHVRDGG